MYLIYIVIWTERIGQDWVSKTAWLDVDAFIWRNYWTYENEQLWEHWKMCINYIWCPEAAGLIGIFQWKLGHLSLKSKTEERITKRKDCGFRLNFYLCVTSSKCVAICIEMFTFLKASVKHYRFLYVCVPLNGFCFSYFIIFLFSLLLYPSTSETHVVPAQFSTGEFVWIATKIDSKFANVNMVTHQYWVLLITY